MGEAGASSKVHLLYISASSSVYFTQIRNFTETTSFQSKIITPVDSFSSRSTTKHSCSPWSDSGFSGAVGAH